jgi:hypothetical protein
VIPCSLLQGEFISVRFQRESIIIKEEFEKAQKALELERWQEFGNAMEKLRKLLILPVEGGNK